MALTCINCGSKRVDTRDDKSNVLFVNPTLGKTMYGKEYVCKDCAKVWKEGETE